MSTNDTTDLLDILEAVTEIRVANPEMRSAALTTMRLLTSNGFLVAGRIYSMRGDDSISSIISHGDMPMSVEDEEALVRRVWGGEEVTLDGLLIRPLARDHLRYGVAILHGATNAIGSLLVDLFTQWHAVDEFLNVQKAELVDENQSLREEIKLQFNDRNIIGVSGALQHILTSARRVAASTATVLIQGETGTGKELIARLIHEYSPRSNGPFITVNCGALTESLLETELFGHVKGAFTGAMSDRKGRFEAANEGTIFLDEIGEVSASMQVRLLRVLQEMEVVRVGEHKARKLDVRVIAATNRDLEEEVRNGDFRSDLFYRLNVVHLQMPPLRQRQEDIPLLVEHFLGKYSQKNVKYVSGIRREALDMMKAYDWPGNIRELENCIEKMVVLAPTSEITADLLPMAVMSYVSPPGAVGAVGEGGGIDALSISPASFEELIHSEMERMTSTALLNEAKDLYDQVRSRWERHLFDAVLTAVNNNKSKAARLLGITRNTLNSRLGDLSEVKRQWKVD